MDSRQRWAGVALLVAALGAIAGTGLALRTHEDTGGELEAPLAVGTEVPRITATAIDGSRIELPGKADRPVVVLFWATWCKPCDEPSLAPFRRTAAEPRGVRFVAVAYGDSPDQVESVLAAEPIPAPVVLGLEDQFAAWRVNAIPYWLFVDDAGRVAGTHRGPLSNLAEVINALERRKDLPKLVQPPPG